MSNAQAVKDWRNRTKQRIIDAMGSKCQSCGYNKCNDALEIHHLDPKEKEFTFGGVRANPKSWDKIVLELKKCTLLCANCHREYHAGTRDIKNVSSFNSEYEKYKNVEVMDSCPVCGKDKPKRQKTCSYSCAATLTGKINWESIDLWNMMLQYDCNWTKMSELIGCSDSAVRKRAVKLGYWDT